MADAVDHDHDHQPHSGWFIPRLNTAEPGGKKKKKKEKEEKEKKKKEKYSRTGRNALENCAISVLFFCYLVNVDGARSKAWQYATGIIYFSRHQPLLSRRRNICLEGLRRSEENRLDVTAKSDIENLSWNKRMSVLIGGNFYPTWM